MTSPIDTTLPAPRSGWRRVLRWIRNSVLAVLLVFGLWVVQRLYFIATPEAPTPERLALDERVQAGNVDSDGGLLLMGFLAPADMDPVAYGRCVLEAARSTRPEANTRSLSEVAEAEDSAAEAQAGVLEQQREARTIACAEGRALLAAPDRSEQARPELGWTSSQWAQAAKAPLHAHLEQRFDTAMDSTSRSIRAENFSDPLPKFSELIAVNRSKVANLRAAWRDGNRQAAEADWMHLIEAWPTFANQNLISAMIAAVAQTDHLLAIHNLALEQDSSASASDWAALVELTRTTDNMVDAIVPAVENERTFFLSLQNDLLASMTSGSSWRRALSKTVFDESATSNIHADMVLRGAKNAHLSASGMAVAPQEQASGRPCPGFPLLTQQNMAICGALGRNGVGIILMSVAEPNYASFGTRIADLRNFAAATRLTLEARRQGIAPGKVSADWVRNAPADMRDVFTGDAFEYNPERKVLRVLLRERSTVLGDAGKTYELPI
ncbi:hypothetical protein [Hydrogenophaga sp. 5NK40-0174]|uniref:hypothetical protein n=1 Tax=Hydrogenophaga sp. 5NK40-0174 TaxID=3127649 RepID=UPI0031086E10